jgi:molybdate transport repressor ModE-like protein
MKVELRLGGLASVNGREVALRQTFILLEGIARERSLRGAAEVLSLSYRAAWARLAALEAAMARPLVSKTRGHGTVLTSLGEQLRSSLERTFKHFEASILREQRDLEQRLGELVRARPPRLKLAISHDPTLIEVLGNRDDVEFAVTGSQAALDRLLADAVDVAGCHFGPAERAEEPRLPPDRNLVADAAFEREQGLIVASGNPLALRSVADLARLRARYINRQRGSGTRAWFDRLLAAASIAPGDILGYDAEEFTHHAVAATVASGAADAGLGVRASAEAFGLGFVPLGRETYFFIRRDDFASPVLDALAAEIRMRADGCAREARAARQPPSSRPAAP